MHKVFLSARKAFVDTLAMIVFATASSMPVEIFILGMSLEQSAKARLVAVPINLLAGRPYGIFRDWVLRKMTAENEGRFKKGLADTVSYACWQVPQYTLVLTISGANLRQIAVACVITAIFAIFVGWGYGLFLDLVRWLFGKTAKTPV
jgi:hypothetical protein